MLRALILALMLVTGQPAAAQIRLLMLDQPVCEWCDLWDAEVGVIYDKTAEGREAPLLRQGIREPLPESIDLTRPARYTPTFILLDGDAEVGRIEGYPGEDFFYSLLQRLLRKAAAGQQ